MKIDVPQFSLSLMQEGHRANIFTTREIESIQRQALSLLGEQIRRYNRDESSSVKEETAQSILQSIFYCINLYLMSRENLGERVNLLKNTGLKEIHSKGVKRTKTCLDQAKALYREVKRTRLDLSLAAYNATIDEGINDFFKNYDVEFSAHDTPAGSDYPLLCDDMSLTGVSYIKNYLEKLKMENELCQHFSPDDLNLLLKRYGQQYGFDFREMLINVAEVILKNSLSSVLLGKSAAVPAISLEETDRLEKKLRELTKQQCFAAVQDALDQMMAELRITDLLVQEYLRWYLDRFSPELFHVVERNTLSSLLVTGQIEDVQPVLVYQEGKKLSDEKLRAVIDELLQCRDAAAKVSLIRSEVHSLEDLREILGAVCIFGDEYEAVFDLLGDCEMALLVAEFFADALFTGSKALIVDEWHGPENEIYWLKQLSNYLTNGDDSRREKILHLAKAAQNAIPPGQIK